MSKLFAIETGNENPILRKKSKKIKVIDLQIKKLANTMLQTMVVNKGVGLAAPQIGQNIRLFIMRYMVDEDKLMYVAIINPEILNISREDVIREEGCLSLPNIWKKTVRPKWIEIKFQDLSGNVQIWKLRDLNARVALHETDHLDGILFIDRAIE